MNKSQLVDALAARIGDRRLAATVVDSMLETIVDTVRAGGSVSLSGFGVFEGRARSARQARNPRTGEAVQVPATTVPAFRAGLGFRTAVGSGGRPAPATRRTRATPATPPASSTEAAAVADAPAKIARGSAGTSPAGRAKVREKVRGKADTVAAAATDGASVPAGSGKGSKGKPGTATSAPDTVTAKPGKDKSGKDQGKSGKGKSGKGKSGKGKSGNGKKGGKSEKASGKGGKKAKSPS